MTKKITHSLTIKRSLILIMLLTIVTSCLCGCSMIFGEPLPEEEERVTKTAYGLSYEIPKDYVTTVLQLSNGSSANAWVNDPDNLEFYFAFTTMGTDVIDIDTYNWLSTGYFTGQVTYYGQTITVSPKVQNPSVRNTDSIEINGNKGYKTKVTYDLYDSENKLVNHTETIYIIQFDEIIASIVFETKTDQLSKYEPLMDIIINSFKLA